MQKGKYSYFFPPASARVFVRQAIPKTEAAFAKHRAAHHPR
jgi:hypothetical protein